MARVSTAGRAYLHTLVIVFSLTTIVLGLFFLTPYLIEHPAAVPTAAAVAWAKDAIEHMLASLAAIMAFILLISLVMNNVCEWSAAPPGPVALEEGIAAPTSRAAGEAAHQPAGAVVSRLPVTTKLLMVSFIYFATWHIFRRTEIVSSERPSLKNLGSALLYLCRGLTVPELALGLDLR